jgi:hypothetical protein
VLIFLKPYSFGSLDWDPVRLQGLLKEKLDPLVEFGSPEQIYQKKYVVFL